MGSVQPYQTAQGRRYRVLYRRPDHTQTSKRGFKTKRDAELYLAENEVAKAKGSWIDASEAKVTVGALAGDWLTHQSHLKPSSLDPIERAYRLHVAPLWSARPIGEIRSSEVQAWVTTLGKVKGATVVRRAHGVLASILDSAVRDRRILTNPARGVNLPRKVPKARVYLSHAQVAALAAASGRHGTLVRLLAYSGLRWGEAVALHVGSVDTLRRRLLVQENAVRVAGKIVVGTPKSHAARSVPYPAFLTEPIAELCQGKTRDELLFGDGSMHLRTPSTRDGWFKAALDRAQLEHPDLPRVTLHDLRHTAASLAISAGANVKAVQRMLGHASAAMTLDTYADLFDDDLDAVANALDEAFSRANVANPLPRSPATPREVAQLPNVSGDSARP